MIVIALLSPHHILWSEFFAAPARDGQAPFGSFFPRVAHSWQAIKAGCQVKKDKMKHQPLSNK
jgi:hypothetical protein